jgi:hypothetical protein
MESNERCANETYREIRRSEFNLQVALAAQRAS